jgi:hypothetical protein
MVHAGLMLIRYGWLPNAPVLGDEVVINDASISLARGTGYVARSFTDSQYGFDTVFAHFPPIYPLAQALAFKLFGVSAYSLRLTTTVMSIAAALVLLLLLYDLARAATLDWETAALLFALYASNASLAALERTARMESTISLLALLSLWATLRLAGQAGTDPHPRAAATDPPASQSPGLLRFVLAGIPAALCMAVHPEAITAVLLIGAILLFVVPGAARVRLGAIALLALTPVAITLIAFRHSLVPAFHQFVDIYNGERQQEQSTLVWFTDRTHFESVTALSRLYFLVLLMVLFALVPLVWRRLKPVIPGSFRARLIPCVAIVGILQLLLLLGLFRMSDRRIQFLLGPMLVVDAICLFGAAPPRAWQRQFAWIIIAGQVLMGAFYVAPRQDAIDANPDRYLALVRSLPANVSLAATPSLWLDLQEVHRPFSLLYLGLDGEMEWAKHSANPLDRFDVIVLDKRDVAIKWWWVTEAAAGRTKYPYRIGSEQVDVYMKPGLSLRNP